MKATAPPPLARLGRIASLTLAPLASRIGINYKQAPVQAMRRTVAAIALVVCGIWLISVTRRTITATGLRELTEQINAISGIAAIASVAATTNKARS